MTPEEELKFKKAFALELLKAPKKSFECARKVFGHDTSMAVKYHSVWPLDPDVIAFQKEFLEEAGPDVGLPSAEEFARAVYDLAEEAPHVDDKIKAFKLYGEIRGYIQKPGTTVNVQNNTNKVMVIRDGGDLDSWEGKSLEQQKNLLLDAAPKEE